MIPIKVMYTQCQNETLKPVYRYKLQNQEYAVPFKDIQILIPALWLKEKINKFYKQYT